MTTNHGDEIKIDLTEIKDRIGKFSNLYKEKRSNPTFSALIMGLYGVGKTSLIATGRRPILIDSFDPNGTLVLEQNYKKEIESGELVIRTFWNESSKAPSQHSRWEDIFERDIGMRFFDYFGTYAIDSFTTWLDAVANRVSQAQGRNRKVQKLAMQDYQIVYDYAKDTIKSMAEFSCDFIVTAHLERFTSEDTDSLVTDIRTYKNLRVELPLLFTEKYVLATDEEPPTNANPSGIRRKLYTAAAGTYRASTQLGAGNRLDAVEKPDLKHILEKVGLPTEDKVMVSSDREETAEAVRKEGEENG